MNLTLKNQLDRAERQRHDVKEWTKKQLEYSIYLNGNGRNPCVYEQQIGRSMSAVEFDKGLRKLNANLVTEVHPYNANKRCLYRLTGVGREYICAFENGFITENSVFSAKAEEVPDEGFIKTKVVGGVPFSHINKSDIPKSEFVPGKGLVFESNIQPGYKNVDIPWTEVSRGWRTVLRYIAEQKINTPTEIENVFGTLETPAWSRSMGKSNPVELW